MGPVRAIVLTLRPHQWVKNLFVAAPLVFAKKLGDPAGVLSAGAAVLAFCALSGAVYALNDVVDADKDRAHPVKCHRPIASGALSPRLALVLAAVLAAGALGLAFALAPSFGAVAAVYLVQNLAYSLKLKQVAFIDVSVIAVGFLLRVLGGAFAVHVPPSPWLLACTALLAAFLGFGKRAHELALAKQAIATDPDRHVGKTRSVLSQYRGPHLRGILYVLAVLTSVAYILYTQDPHTVRFFGGRGMIATAPFCMVGIIRYLTLLGRPHGDSPTEAMLRDRPFMANLALWGVVVLAIVYVGW